MATARAAAARCYWPPRGRAAFVEQPSESEVRCHRPDQNSRSHKRCRGKLYISL